MKNIILTLSILLLVAGTASAEIGKASFYTVKSSGLVTANGERYNEDAFTCASMSHDFNTLLRVTNIENGKSVIVRVNDRGGFKKYGRILDLSKGAFSAIGNLKQGLLKVNIEVVNPKVNSPFTLYEYLRANFIYQNEAEGVDEWKEPARTEKDKGGDCEDFALYAEKVLQNLGYESHAIAIKGRDKFFHAICVVKMEDGRYRYFSNQYYSYFKSFESINEIVEFECNDWKWWAEIGLPHEIKNFHHQVVSGN